MPNNLQILAYVQSMKDMCKGNIDRAIIRGGTHVDVLSAQYLNLTNLEKFIRGEK